MLYFTVITLQLHSRWLILACTAFSVLLCCQLLPRMLFCCQALRLHALQLVYNRLFRDSRQLQNVRLYKYNDTVKMHSRRVSLRLVAFPRFACCKVFGSLQAGIVMWCA